MQGHTAHWVIRLWGQLLAFACLSPLLLSTSPLQGVVGAALFLDLQLVLVV